MSAVAASNVEVTELASRTDRDRPLRWLIVAAFAAVYVIWGSTYLAMAIAVETIPPLLMAGGRALIAGLILYTVMRLRGVAKPKPRHWLNSAYIGGLLLFAGNGGVSWAEQSVPSGIAALIVAAVPLWMILIDWLRPSGQRPHRLIFVGLTLGFVGVATIILDHDSAGNHVVDPIGAIVLLGATLFWAIGSVWSPYLEKPADALLSVAMQMIAGGSLQVVGGVVGGELRGFSLASVSTASANAFIYLTLIGSLIGFTAYVWLLQVSTPARVSTYAFVNPLIAVFLGRVLHPEQLPSSVIFAGALIVASVVLITLRGGRKEHAKDHAAR